MKVLQYKGHKIAYNIIPEKKSPKFFVMGVIYNCDKILGECTIKVNMNNACILIFRSIEYEYGECLYDFMVRYVVHVIQDIASNSGGICPKVNIYYNNELGVYFCLEHDYLCDKWIIRKI